MASLWTYSNKTRNWVPTELSDSRFLGIKTVSDDPDNVLVCDAESVTNRGDFVIVQSLREGAGDFVLIAPSKLGIRINGKRVPGLKVLSDKDEIDVGRSTLFFSTQTPLKIENFDEVQAGTKDGGQERPSCPVCEAPIGGLCVRCSCGIWYHEDEDREFCCWSSGSVCLTPGCNQKTSLGNQQIWSPDGL